MNTAQKVVVIIGLAVMIALGLAPHKTSRATHKSEGLVPLWITSEWTDSGDVGLDIDYGTLILSWTLTALVTGACVLVIGIVSKRDDAPRVSLGSFSTTVVLLVFIGALAVVVARGQRRIVVLEDEVHGLISLQTDELDSLRDRVGELEGMMNQQADAIHNLLGLRSSMSMDVSEMSGFLIGLSSGVSNLSNDVSRLTIDVSNVSSDVRRLCKVVRSRDDFLEETFSVTLSPPAPWCR